MTNVCYVLALRYGAATSSLVFWAIGGIVAFAIFAFLFMGETMNAMKVLGIVLGIASVVLITKAS